MDIWLDLPLMLTHSRLVASATLLMSCGLPLCSRTAENQML